MFSKLLFLNGVSFTCFTTGLPAKMTARAPFQETDERHQSTPHLIQLRRESVPVKRKGEIVSHKTSYSGVISLGAHDNSSQDFRVVFDTGSGHIVLPDKECKSESCLLHNRYDISSSSSATKINADGSKVPEDELCDQVNIGYGTGAVTGELVRETICLGSGVARSQSHDRMCVETQIVSAVAMSTNPFKNFHFDGILGLSLPVLAISPEFSFFNMLAGSGRLGAPHFSFFLTDGREGETSEIAIGGHNPARLQEALSWSPVSKPELGYWMVDISAVRINGVEMDVCRDGSCRGVMDTGTSHIGVPAAHDNHFAKLLTRDAGDLHDCSQIDGAVLEFEIKGLNITLTPENYMRPLPLRQGVSVSSSRGVASPMHMPASSSVAPSLVRADGKDVERYCRPRLMPVNLAAPIGPRTFIFGEPILQRYYTVFDWKNLQIGMGLSTNGKRKRLEDPSPPTGEAVILLQIKITFTKGRRKQPPIRNALP